MYLYRHNYRFRGSLKRTPSYSPYLASDSMSQDFTRVPEVQKSLSDAVYTCSTNAKSPNQEQRSSAPGTATIEVDQTTHQILKIEGS